MKKTGKLLCVIIAAALLISFPLNAKANVKGDVDGNGIIEAADARSCLRRAVDLEDYPEDSPEYYACDVTNDGFVLAEDARLILRAAVGLVQFTEPPAGEHKWDEGVVTKEATCKEEGIKTYTCSDCGETKTEAIPKTTEHKWDEGTVTTAATCKKTGEMTYTCAVCGTTKKETIPKSTEHNWDNGRTTKSATCTTDGEKTYTCTICRTTKTEKIPASGHNWGAWKRISDTQHQRVCQTNRSHTEKANHTWDAGKVTKAATTTSEGERVYTCTVCNATKTEKIAKIPAEHVHEYKLKYNGSTHWYECTCGAQQDTAEHTWDEGRETKAATCKEEGEKTFTCTVCGATMTEAIAKLTTHTWNNGYTSKSPTCAKEGEKTYKCTVCGSTMTEPIPKTTDHKWIADKLIKAATCTEEGERQYKCNTCGATKTEPIAKTAHKWNNGTVTKAATCKEEGEKTYKCTACDATKTESIARLTTHTWDNGTVTKAAACTKAGVKTYVCTVCGATKTETIPQTGHRWNEGVIIKEPTEESDGTKLYTCTVCYETKTETVHYMTQYDIIRSGKFYMTGALTTSEGTEPLTLAIDDGFVYMSAVYESTNVALITIGNKAYMACPDKKIYVDLNGLIVQYLTGISPEKITEGADMGFKELKPLAQADSVADGRFNSKNCKVYTFNSSDGTKTLVYMDGDILLAIENYSSAGNRTSRIRFDSVSDTIPNEVRNATSIYREVTLAIFASSIG